MLDTTIDQLEYHCNDGHGPYCRADFERDTKTLKDPCPSCGRPLAGRDTKESN